MGNRNININQGNYNENVDGDYVQQNVIIDDDGDMIIISSKGKKGKRTVSKNISITGGNINVTGAGAFSLGDITGNVANTVNQTIVQQSSTNISKEVELKQPTDGPSEYRVFKSQVNTIADMIKLSACNMPVDASRIERFMVGNEILERIEKNPDLVKVFKENNKEVRQMLFRELGENYTTIILLVAEEIQR